MSVIGTATVDVKVAPEDATLENLALAEMRKVVARKQVLERKKAQILPELERMDKRLEALKVLNPNAEYEVTNSGRMRAVEAKLAEWSYFDGKTYKVTSAFLSHELGRLKYKTPESVVEDRAEEFVDVVTRYGSVPIFWYMIRELYHEDVEAFMAVYAQQIGAWRTV
jgi:hypothetical protein